MQNHIFRLESLWLLLPPLALCALDLALTLYGQSEQYWNGEYGAMSEVSPSFAAYLAISPFAFLLAGLLWMAIFSALIVILPEMLAITLAISIMLGHLNGAFTWLTYRFESYQASNALFLLTAFLIVVAFRNGRSDTGRAALDWSQTSLPAWSRWVLVATLLVLPIWWFLIPH